MAKIPRTRFLHLLAYAQLRTAVIFRIYDRFGLCTMHKADEAAHRQAVCRYTDGLYIYAGIARLRVIGSPHGLQNCAAVVYDDSKHAATL